MGAWHTADSRWYRTRIINIGTDAISLSNSSYGLLTSSVTNIYSTDLASMGWATMTIPSDTMAAPSFLLANLNTILHLRKAP